MNKIFVRVLVEQQVEIQLWIDEHERDWIDNVADSLRCFGEVVQTTEPANSAVDIHLLTTISESDSTGIICSRAMELYNARAQAVGRPERMFDGTAREIIRDVERSVTTLEYGSDLDLN